jgi:sirohydrochlorin cobaltochelatase
METVAARLRAVQPGTPVRCAYLELDAPDLPQAAGELAASGARTITIVPMFLGTGRHAREDLPALVQELRARHPQVSFVCRSPSAKTAGSWTCWQRSHWNKKLWHNEFLS